MEVRQRMRVAALNCSRSGIEFVICVPLGLHSMSWLLLVKHRIDCPEQLSALIYPRQRGTHFACSPNQRLAVLRMEVKVVDRIGERFRVPWFEVAHAIGGKIMLHG